MPGMDCYEATREIRGGAAGVRYKDITIMAMTANAMKADKEALPGWGNERLFIKAD